jgi:hypothetical protein
MATIAMLLSSCTPTPPTQIETKILTASGAQQVFNDLFRSYQSGFTTVPWDGEFDFEGTVNIDGDAKKIESLGLHTFQQPFSSFSTKAYGYYSFSNLLSPQIDITIKSYLNTENTGRGDLDMSLQTTQSGGMQLQVNSLERKLLTFFEFSDETIEALLVSFEKNKGLAQEFPIG